MNTDQKNEPNCIPNEHRHTGQEKKEIDKLAKVTFEQNTFWHK